VKGGQPHQDEQVQRTGNICRKVESQSAHKVQRTGIFGDENENQCISTSKMLKIIGLLPESS